MPQMLFIKEAVHVFWGPGKPKAEAMHSVQAQELVLKGKHVQTCCHAASVEISSDSSEYSGDAKRLS